MNSSVILFLIIGALLAALMSVSSPPQALLTMLGYILGGFVTFVLIVIKKRPDGS